MLSYLDCYKVFKREKALLYTDRQGQYLTFIYYYAKLYGYPPAQADIQRYFGITRSFRQQHAQNPGKTRSYIESSPPTALNQVAPVPRGTSRPVISRSILPSISHLISGGIRTQKMLILLQPQLIEIGNFNSIGESE